MSSSALGKGLESLIPTDFIIEEQFDPTIQSGQDSGNALEISLADIEPNEHQPRMNFKDGPMADMVESIRVHGVIQPVVVSPKVGGGYNLVAGERRWRASNFLKLKTIPAIVRTPSDQEKLELALVENVQREDLGPLETATAYVKLNQQFNLSFEDVAKKVGKALSTVLNATRLLNLPPEAKKALYDKEISEGHARVLAGMNMFPEAQLELLAKIIKEGWSVRQAEQFSVITKSQDKLKKAARTEDVFKKREELVSTLKSRLNTVVELKPRSKGGRLVIDYDDDDDLARIVNNL
ncbi:MAG: ParB family transcriptional regulator, chromosome partitioning protein [Patescibacteria group bacterium]|nr:ParB family transcriptional regulator, chromosome partitioning protein [Patescibacteria group bacterium]